MNMTINSLANNGENEKCIINGETFYVGDSFYPPERPDLVCQCKKGFKGMIKFRKFLICDFNLLAN